MVVLLSYPTERAFSHYQFCLQPQWEGFEEWVEENIKELVNAGVLTAKILTREFCHGRGTVLTTIPFIDILKGAAPLEPV